MKEEAREILDLRGDPFAVPFIEGINKLTEADLKVLFDFKENSIPTAELTGLSEQEKTIKILQEENKWRSDKQKALFSDLMIMIRNANPNIKNDISNVQLKALTIEALNIAHENAKDENEKAEITKKIAAINSLGSTSATAKQKKSDDTHINREEALVKEVESKIQAIMQSSLRPAEKLSALKRDISPYFQKGNAVVDFMYCQRILSLDRNDSVAQKGYAEALAKLQEDQNTEKEKPSLCAQLGPKKENGYNFHPFVDRSKEPILAALKEQGYKNIEKDEQKGICKLVKENGKGIDISKSGNMKGEKMGFDQNVDKLAAQAAEDFLAMMQVQYNVAQKEGMDLAFPDGTLNLSIVTANLKGTPEEKQKIEAVNKLAKKQLLHLIATKHPDTLGKMLDKFQYDGKKMELAANKAMKSGTPKKHEERKENKENRGNNRTGFGRH